MSKHAAAISRISCPWRRAVAMVMAFVTAGVFVPYAYTMRVESPADEEDEETVVPPPLFEGHGVVNWPPAVSLVHPGRKETPELHKPTDSKPQTQHKNPPKTIKVSTTKKPKPTESESTPASSSDTSTLVSFLRAQLGDRYVLGGNGPDIWDCSGLTLAAYARIGISLPRTSELQSLRGHSVSMSSLKVGDLLFWGLGPGLAYHVAIYIGGGNYIAAQNPSVGVVERSLSYSPPGFARRIL